MTRPTDASIARAFWEEMEEAVEAHHTPTLHEFLSRVKRLAEVLESDAESPAGTSPEPMNLYGTNSGHGHVWARPDGVKARCGGPGFCRECKQDLARACGIVNTIPEKVCTSTESTNNSPEKRTCSVSTCRAEMRPGLRCKNPYCGLA